jgi:hypothetical protein
MEKYSIIKTKFIIASIASVYFLYYCFSYKDWHLVDNINLIIHEAGHSIFILLGQFVSLLGGTILQIMLPIVFVVYFIWREEYFSASLLLFWVGQNFINVSVYVSDAIVMQLPLLGGDSSIHDWNSILQTVGLLKYSNTIGSFIYTIGFLIILCAIYYSFYNSFFKKDFVSY